jgi:chromosome segregation ATPase
VEVLKVKLAGQNASTNSQIEALRVENEGLRESGADLLRGREELAAANADTEKRRASLEEELARTQAHHAAVLSDLESQLENGRSRCADTAAALGKRDEEMRQLKEAMSDLEAVNHSVAVAAQDRLVEASAARARLSDVVQQLLEQKALLDAQEEQAKRGAEGRTAAPAGRGEQLHRCCERDRCRPSGRDGGRSRQDSGAAIAVRGAGGAGGVAQGEARHSGGVTLRGGLGP